MTGRRLVLLRHGRTAWNHEGRVQGQLEVDLDDVGRAQAARVAPYLAAMAPSALWVSDLARTRQTAEPVAAACGLEPRLDPRLREFFFGVREGSTHAEFAEIDPVGFDALRRGDYDGVATAERTADVRRRTLAALGELLDALGPGETGVAVSHGAAVRVAVAALLGWPDDVFHTLRGLDNCHWAELLDTPEDGRLRLRAYNVGAVPAPLEEPVVG